MKTVITKDKRKRHYYEKGDKVYHLIEKKVYTIDSIDIETKKFKTPSGEIIDLTPDIKPLKDTIEKSVIIDESEPSNEDIIRFAKLRPDAKIPSKRDEDGCYDIYACFDEDEWIIQPLDIALIPTGIISAFDKKYRAELRERGSSGTKGMARRAGQIDSGYRDEWFFPINNTTTKVLKITKSVTSTEVTSTEILYPYTKAVGQIAMEIVPVLKVEETTVDEIRNIKSERGTGKLGSSNK